MTSPSQPSAAAPRRRMFVDLDPLPATTPAGYFAGIDAPLSPSMPDSAVTMHSPHHGRARSGSTQVPEPLRFGSLAVAGEDMTAKPVRRDRNGFAESSVFFDPGNVEPETPKRRTSTVATPSTD
ncbi:hypothetical protein AMAG_00175 [Allomyces macrogynus ATCC 38327]|nr:hypothetical protein AMAG_00175 [Allomyces macrogynus ATCC 38327]|eukprot:KNE54180.1 hypothetical protein AMAG_00175 [Allomyces macrogynus ATCC 38327]